jgi:hypothetical protein
MFRGVDRLRLCAFALLTLAGAWCVWFGLHPTVTMIDQNNDGRIDVWEYHDGPFGTVTKIVEDTNFDGRPDRFSYIAGGVLRRESDTNFDDRVDQIEEFDVDGDRTRTVRDTDHDGIADLLVLYRDGVPVYAQRAGAGAVVANVPTQQGNSLIDPFENETRVCGKARKVESLTALLSRSKLYDLAPCRGSPCVGNPVRVFTLLSSSSQFDPGPLVPRGPPPL